MNDDLFEQVISFENLFHAAKKAVSGKRGKTAPAEFHLNRSKYLVELQQALQSGEYQPGSYHTFTIFEPKKRLISAAPFIDRVVHHAICRVIEPIFEPTFIYDSYACRKGKGTHAAIDRFTYYARRYRFVLKCDVQKFFPSLDHDILKQQIRRKIRDVRLLAFIDRIIDNSNPQETVYNYFPGDDLFTPFERRKGIPIGNLTSQFFANIYLNRFDHFIKDDLGIKGYIRYVDDMAMFGDDACMLHSLLSKSINFLSDVRLRLHPNKCHVFQTSKGVPFLGFTIFPDHRLVRRTSVTRFKRRLQKLQKQYQAGYSELADVRSSIHAWLGHVKHADSLGLRTYMLLNAVFKRGQVHQESCARGRVQQQS
ncbi:group II intron reverse transcriptase domain-containing protein [candidate division KSB1 bacterium]|nr:group II intron reverse transcriptase domain-containing protein [candidate division KSB1 bacterium]